MNEHSTNKQPDQAEALSLKLFVVLSHTHKTLMEHALRDMRRYGLNPTEFTVLELLYHKGPHPIQQIGDKILLASGSLTYVIDKLEKKELLIRKPSHKDRRITYVEISEKGKELFDDIFPQHAKAIHQVTEGLTAEEKQTAVDLLKKLGLYAKAGLG
ncbi:MarR family winged helix-turn-helix transcriptional regulator [Brevibacillus dissolubilis]|uniref:MarR family winged helix-turn-helix transcriptional regulator n=1 Tax=Brevibacillus dissolubilis TaxID=1844116 RepID=UPI001116E91F|nr:MarR family transcriptional regulator [Brevibacillus dissolubilis]